MGKHPGWKRTEATRLRSAGVSTKVIAEALDVGNGTVARWTSPGSAERNRAYCKAYKRANRERLREYDREYASRPENTGFCAECGEQMASLAGTKGRPRMCLRCRRARADAGRRELQALWKAGVLLRDIAEAVGRPTTSVSVEIVKMRAAGWDVPYRYNYVNGVRVGGDT